MMRAYFNVEGQLSYDHSLYKVVKSDETGGYVLRDLISGAEYTPTVCLFKTNAVVGENDILVLDTQNITVDDVDGNLYSDDEAEDDGYDEYDDEEYTEEDEDDE